MSHRKDNSPGISFFSFQDIITSVTGIMFLVVLMLVLMLLMRQKYTDAEKKDIQEINAMKSELQQLQEQLLQFQQSSENIAKRLQELEKLDIKEIPHQLNKVTQELALLTEQNRQFEEKRLDATERLEGLKQEMEEQKNTLRMGGQELKAKDAELQKLITQEQPLLEKSNTIKRTMRFTWKRQSSKKPLLVECGNDFIRAGLSQDKMPLVCIKGKNGDELSAKFMHWLKGYKKESYYLLLLAKPSSFAYIEQLSQLLSSSGYERGREVLPADDTLIFQEETP